MNLMPRERSNRISFLKIGVDLYRGEVLAKGPF